jgi:SDR family mycofactocin-dependent oxidoreductase
MAQFAFSRSVPVLALRKNRGEEVGRVDGKVAFITGAARGQGRSHAIRLAQEGADIIAVDVGHGFDTVPYDGATEADLAETVKEVEALDRRIVARQADVRDLHALQAAVDDGLSEFGKIDIVSANAGICSFAPALELTEEMWREMLDINVTGVWKTVKVTVPSMIERGEGGSVILTSSIAGLVAFPNLAHYTAAKHAITGLMRTLALEFAPQRIRVNSVHPTTVDTPMVQNEPIYSLFLGVRGATREQAAEGMKVVNAVSIPWVDPVDISNAVLYLASDEARYVTGTTTVIDAGALHPFKVPQ